jgi:two-component system NtrC family sensor kinase
MVLTLKTRLAASIAVVVLIMGVGSTIIGTRLFGDSLVAQVQRGVEHDLNTAFLVYNTHLCEIQTQIEFIAREPDIVEAVSSGRRRSLSTHLAHRQSSAGLDVLAVTDVAGIVLSRAAPSKEHGDDQSKDQTISHVMENRASVAATAVVPGDMLALESPKLADRARMDILETPRARPSDLDVLPDGMMLKAAAPIMAEGKLIGVVYGGVLLNRGEDIVDSVKETAYAGETWHGKDIGAATIFQDDVRIATNVLAGSGDRALGTRVSEEVYDRVVKGGERWGARAFVVDDWYITAYGPIRDLDERVVGILRARSGRSRS